MNYDEIDGWILNSKANRYEQEHNIETISISTLMKFKDIAFKKALKSDDTHTLFVCIKTNRNKDNWIYIAPTESQVKKLSNVLEKMYKKIDENNMHINKKKEMVYEQM